MSGQDWAHHVIAIVASPQWSGIDVRMTWRKEWLVNSAEVEEEGRVEMK
ncbi:hypothetical protein ANO11243_030720 [Dothideomycetidae sp. 11243]|nr:hypothetical protein ANO11243_030720 [fungal sp. No.11243]